MYPLMAPLVRRTGGEIFSVKEELAVDLSRLVAYEKAIKIGPASAVGLLGLFEALKKGLINNNETVFINIGENANRALDFLKEVAYTTENISSANQCKRFNRNDYTDKVWQVFEAY